MFMLSVKAKINESGIFFSFFFFPFLFCCCLMVGSPKPQSKAVHSPTATLLLQCLAGHWGGRGKEYLPASEE